MSLDNHFNYIVPIFNKEDILPGTLEGIHICASPTATIYTVLDGCTDGSEKVVDDFIARTQRDVRKLYMNDVHMLRSVNAALREIQGGFTIIMQDDIILKDPETEVKLVDLYRKMNGRLGIVSFRFGSNVRLVPWYRRIRRLSMVPLIEEVDFLKGPDEVDAASSDVTQVEYGKFYPRMSAINGPNCIPWEVLSNVKELDEHLAPYGFDDPEICLRAMKAGYINGIFPVAYESEPEWGGTRRSKSFLKEVARIHKRNRRYIAAIHGKFILELWKSGNIYRKIDSFDGPDF